MRMSTGTAIGPQLEAKVPAVTLARFLSSLVSEGFCFCCGSPTDLLLDSAGFALVRCACCGAEILAEETRNGEKGDLVVRAA